MSRAGWGAAWAPASAALRPAFSRASVVLFAWVVSSGSEWRSLAGFTLLYRGTTQISTSPGTHPPVIANIEPNLLFSQP